MLFAKIGPFIMLNILEQIIGLNSVQLVELS